MDDSHDGAAAFSKAISPARDRLQSLALVVLLSLALLGLAALRLAAWQRTEYPSLAAVLALSAGFSALAWAVRAATPGAALAGGLVCLLVCSGFGPSLLHTGLVPLATLFVLTYLASRAGRAYTPETERRHGRRAAQVLANLGVAGLVAGWPRASALLLTAALAEATADTVSSETGQAFGGRPWLGLRQVEPGTDGAVSLLGTAAGIAAASALSAAGCWALHLRLQSAAVAAAAGIFGLGFDTLLGATLERRGWLGNDLVNFLSTAAAALAAFALAALLH